MHKYRITISPYHHLKMYSLPQIFSDKKLEEHFQNKEIRFLPSGRKAIEIVLKALKPKKNDEVFISTSTENTYVSSCVTCTIFNFCKPSRVLSNKTKLIFIIHEYGMPNPKTKELLTYGQKKGIPVMEDCAHTFDSKFEGRFVGAFGNYTLYSLPKLFPVKYGGILVSKGLPIWKPSECDKKKIKYAKESFFYCVRYLDFFKEQRKKNFRYLQKQFCNYNLLFAINKDSDREIVPYFFPLITPEAERVYNEFSEQVEWGKSNIKDLLLFPIHPLLRKRELDYMVNLAKRINK